jgi:hypothetical protein
MDKEQKATDSQQRDERFISVLKELTSFKDEHIEKDLERYRKAVRLPRRVCQVFCVCNFIYRGNRSANSMAKQLRAGSQFRIGMVHFLAMLCIAR